MCKKSDYIPDCHAFESISIKMSDVLISVYLMAFRCLEISEHPDVELATVASEQSATKLLSALDPISKLGLPRRLTSKRVVPNFSSQPKQRTSTEVRMPFSSSAELEPFSPKSMPHSLLLETAR